MRATELYVSQAFGGWFAPLVRSVGKVAADQLLSILSAQGGRVGHEETPFEVGELSEYVPN